MTTPVDPTLNQIVSLASVDELVIQAKRLGLTWGLRPAAVVDIENGAGPYNPRVQMDGDTPDTTMPGVSLVGGLAVGMRVMVMFVPPTGYYIIGIISSSDIARSEVGGTANHATTITTTETLLETFSQFTALSGAVYRVEIDGWMFAADTVLTTFRLRKTNTSGLVLTASDYFRGIGIAQGLLTHVGYFVNNTSASITADLVLTGTTLSGTSVWGADTTRPRYASIQYAGPAAEYPFAVPYT